MIRVLMLDLGDTLVHEHVVFPHVTEALAALTRFRTASGAPLAWCLVSDCPRPAALSTQERIEGIFQECLTILEQAGLTTFFQPVKKRITLSTHAGARKPDRRIFHTAVQRLGLSAGLDECLFITENAEHIAACRKLGMRTLRFGAPGAPGVDFSEWSEAPLLVATIVAPESAIDTELALKTRLAAAHGLELISMKPKSPDGRIHGRVRTWHPVTNPGPGEPEGLHVPLPANVEIALDKRGRIRSVKSGRPAPQDVAESKEFAETLEANRQIAHEAGPLPSGATHQVDTDAKGKRRLKRKRFSAL